MVFFGRGCGCRSGLFLVLLIETAHEHGTRVGICRQSPSDYPEFAAFLVKEGIDSPSPNPDSMIEVKRRVAKQEHAWAVSPIAIGAVGEIPKNPHREWRAQSHTIVKER